MRTVVDIALRTAVNGVALWVASLLVAGVRFGPTVNASLGGQSETTRTVVTVALVALVFGAVNAFIKPLLKALATPLIWLTLGLFTLVVNAAMLALTSWLAGGLGLAFHVDHFWWDAVWGALVVTIVAMVLGAFVPDRR
ncbi:MAG: phage holin family protein [Actinomycetales bacterium]|nr:phage holin family protein [Actinomycetales bacterium]